MMKSLQKIQFILRHSRSLRDALKLMRNTKKYSQLYQSASVNNKNQEAMCYALHREGKPLDVWLRTSTGDIRMFYEVFQEQPYLIPPEILSAPKNIVDLGANVGLTSLWLHTQYPEANIYSVEMSQANYEILQRNAQPYLRIHAVHAAAYPEDVTLRYDEGYFAYNSHINADLGTYSVEGISLNTLFQRYGLENIDLLKVDIEGAEEQLFASNTDWLQKVNAIIIELHENYSVDRFKEDLKSYGFDVWSPPAKQLKMVMAMKNTH